MQSVNFFGSLNFKQLWDTRVYNKDKKIGREPVGILFSLIRFVLIWKNSIKKKKNKNWIFFLVAADDAALFNMSRVSAFSCRRN